MKSHFNLNPLVLALLGISMASFATAIESGHRLEKTIELLLSPSKREQREGEKLADRHADAYRDIIIAGLRDPGKRVTAAYRLRVLVSPWARGVAAGREHKGSITLYLPRRPVARPLDGPQHAACREALLDALRATAAGPKDDERAYTLESICQSLTEIGDALSMSAMARLLEETHDPEVGYPVLESLCRRMGFHHPGATLGPMCGPLFFAESELQDWGEGNPQTWFFDARDAVLHRFDLSDGAFPAREELLRHALDRLDERMRLPEFVHLGYSEGMSDVDKLEPLIRLGEPLLPLLRQRQASEEDLSKKGNYEVIAAAITGKIDPELMRELLASGDRDRGLACQVVIAAGSREWTKDIAQLQFREGFDHKAASQTLASVLRKEAIPRLREALEFDPDNYTARYAIAELEKWPE